MNQDRDYGRTTITVPRELKNKMKQVGAYVNWSAVACEAFEKKMEEIGPVEEISTIDGAIERFKKINSSAVRGASPASSSGFEAGQRWAMNQATQEQLLGLDELRSGIPNSQWADFIRSPEGFRSLTECVNDEEGDHRGRHHRRGYRRWPDGIDMEQPGRFRTAWRSILDRRPDSPDFFATFAEGALDVWKKIKDKL